MTMAASLPGSSSMSEWLASFIVTCCIRAFVARVKQDSAKQLSHHQNVTQACHLLPIDAQTDAVEICVAVFHLLPGDAQIQLLCPQ